MRSTSTSPTPSPLSLVIDGPRVHGLVSMRDLVYQLVRHGQGRFEAAVRAAGANGV